MRVLQVHARYRWRGGEETTVDNDAEVLRNGGHQVFQHFADNPVAVIPSLRSLAVAPYNPTSRGRVERLAIDNDVDVIHVHNTWFSLSPSVFAAGEAAQVPVVATVHNYRLACAQGNLLRDGSICTLCLGGSPLPGIRYRCYRGSSVLSGLNAAVARGSLRLGLWHRLAAVIVPSRFTAEMLVKAGIAEESIVVRPNTAPDPGPRTSAAADSDQILFVGRLAAEKGLHLLLEAWSVTRPALRLVVVGDGPDRSDLEHIAPAGVQFLGWQSPQAVRRLMLESRAMAFPSIWFEACPLVIIEAQAAGLPVFGHRIGAVTEMLEPQGESSIVGQPSLETWHSALDVLGRDDLISNLSARARDNYEERYHPAVALKSLEVIYDSVVSR